jgi:hypothetical protein
MGIFVTPPGAPLGALWVITRVVENGPTSVGEKLTATFIDFPGARLKGFSLFVTENGLERLPTVPSRGAVEENGFSIVIT